MLTTNTSSQIDNKAHVDSGFVAPHSMTRIPDDTQVRYIKLGPGGSWARRCIAEGLVEFSQISVPPELIAAQDRDSWVRYFHAMNQAKGQAASVGTHAANQWLSFSTLPQDGLWITFEVDHLWWTFAAPEIQPIGAQAGTDRGFYTRRSINGWQKTSLNGSPLRKSALSTLLTSVSGYQRTICEVRAREYLIRKINGEEDPAVTAAKAAQDTMIKAAGTLICKLHQDDFETLVDLILNRSGWHRISALGGTQKDTDMVLERAITGETAFVQVKSQASQTVLDRYIRIFDGFDDNTDDTGGNDDNRPESSLTMRAGRSERAAVDKAAGPAHSRLPTARNTYMIFAYHEARSPLHAYNRDDILVWDRTTIANIAIRNGLFDWIIERTG